MTWVKTDDRAREHMKHRGAGTDGFALWFATLGFCNEHLTDGRVEVHLVPDVWRPIGERFNWRAAVDRLVNGCLWHRDGETCSSDLCPANPIVAARLEPMGGYVVHDYFDYQRSKAEIIRERENDANRQRRRRQRLLGADPPGGHGVSHGVTPGVTHTMSHTPPDPDPDPEGERDHTHARERAPLEMPEIEAIAKQRLGKLEGEGADLMRELGTVYRDEVLEALKSDGRTWVYIAKVIATNRRPRPPRRAEAKPPEPVGQGRKPAREVLKEKGMLP